MKIKEFLIKNKKYLANVYIIILASILIGGTIGFSYWEAKYKNRNISEEKIFGAYDIFKASPLEGWGAGLMTTPEYDGVDMPDNALVVADNIDYDVKNSIAPRSGTTILGTESVLLNPVQSLHTSKSLHGRELMVRTSTTTMEWWNSVDSSWDILDKGYTNNQQFTFVDGNTSGEDEMYTYFSNGTEGIRRFRVAFGTIASNNSTSITLNSISDFTTAAEQGFDTSGTTTINGIDYAYSSRSGLTLGGMSGVPALSVNEGVISTVETKGFTDAPTSSVAMVIKDQRLYAAYDNSVFCSAIDDFKNFSFSSPRVAGEGEIIIFPEGGDKITALGIRPDYVAVMKRDYIGSLSFKDYSENLSDIPTVKTIETSYKIGAVNQRSLVQNNYQVFFPNNGNEILRVTRLEQKDYDETDNIAFRIKPTLENYTFSQSAASYFDDRVFSAVSYNGSFNDEIIVYDIPFNRIQKFTGINANSFTVYDGKLYYGDSLSENVYQLFYDDYSDNLNPYSTNWKTKWYNFGAPANWKEVGWVFVEGFINSNTSLSFKINLDDGGSLISKTVSIVGTGDYVAKTTSSGFGTNPFGLSNFSDSSGSAENLKHFVGFINTSDLFSKKFRNIQFEGETSGSGQNYRITKIIPYINILPEEYGRNDSKMIIND